MYCPTLGLHYKCVLLLSHFQIVKYVNVGRLLLFYYARFSWSSVLFMPTSKAPKSMYKTRFVAILSKTKSARICRLFVGICRFTVEQSVNSLNLVSRKIYLSQYTDEKEKLFTVWYLKLKFALCEQRNS